MNRSLKEDIYQGRSELLQCCSIDCLRSALCHLIFPDMAPLSAPAFSYCFPLLNTMLKDSSGSTEESEDLMIRALQVINEHAQLRADTDSADIVIDEVETSSSLLSHFLFCLAPVQRRLMYEVWI